MAECLTVNADRHDGLIARSGLTNMVVQNSSSVGSSDEGGTSTGGVGVGGVTIISSGTDTPADINLRPFLLPNPSHPTCAVTARVVLSSSYISPEARSQPTASPVPSIVLGAINFTVTNLRDTAYQVSGRVLSGCSCCECLQWASIA